MDWWKHAVVVALLASLAPACGDPTPPQEYVARVGTAYLLQRDIDAALGTLANPQDTAEARRQIIEQWITNELLYQEALRRDLRADVSVQRRLEESERAVLIDALVSALYASEEDEITPPQIRTYFERHKDQLRLREPFVRVHHLVTTHPDSAAHAHALLQQAVQDAAADSLWPQIVTRFATDAEEARALGSTHIAESRLFVNQPPVREHLRQLAPGGLAPVIDAGQTYHVLHLADRAPAGTIPELLWVEAEVRRLLAIEARKQMFQRQVQRLRTEAQARDDLAIR